MSNTINYTKLYTLGGNEEVKYKSKTHDELIDLILKTPAINMKGLRDELIEIDTSLDEPTLIWNIKFLEKFDNMSLEILLDFVRITNKNRN